MNVTAMLWGIFVVETLVIVPVTALLVLDIRKVPYKTDPARYGFRWFLATLSIYLSAFIIRAIAYILYIAYFYTDYPRGALAQAYVHLDTVGVLLRIVGDATVLITIASISSGINEISTGSATLKALNVGTKVLALIISIMALSYFIRTQHYLSISIERWDASVLEMRRIDGIISGVTTILTLLGAMIVLGYAIIVKIQSSKAVGAALKTATTFLIIAATINLILRSFDMWAGAEDIQGFRAYSLEWTIAEPVINRWGTLAMLAVLYVLGIMKDGGVWSKQVKDLATGQV